MSKNFVEYEEKDVRLDHIEHLGHGEVPPSSASGDLNPLVGRSKETVIAEVDEFCRANGLDDDRDVFRKGALVAQNPNGFDSIEELTSEDVAALHHSATHKWAHTRKLYFAGMYDGIFGLEANIQLLCAPLVLLRKDGTRLDPTARVGAIDWSQVVDVTDRTDLSFPAEFGINSEVGTPEGNRDEWIVGFVNAAPYISSALL